MFLIYVKNIAQQMKFSIKDFLIFCAVKNKCHGKSPHIYAFKSKETNIESHYVPICILSASMDELQQNL